MLLWLWHEPAATALIQPLAWEPPYAVDAALKRLYIYIPPVSQDLLGRGLTQVIVQVRLSHPVLHFLFLSFCSKIFPPQPSHFITGHFSLLENSPSR